MLNMSQIAETIMDFIAAASRTGFLHVTFLCFFLQEWDVDYLTEEEDGLIYFDGGTFSRGPHWLLPPPAAEPQQGEPEEVHAALPCAVLLSYLKSIGEHQTLAVCLVGGLELPRPALGGIHTMALAYGTSLADLTLSCSGVFTMLLQLCIVPDGNKVNKVYDPRGKCNQTECC